MNRKRERFKGFEVKSRWNHNDVIINLIIILNIYKDIKLIKKIEKPQYFSTILYFSIFSFLHIPLSSFLSYLYQIPVFSHPNPQIPSQPFPSSFLSYLYQIPIFPYPNFQIPSQPCIQNFLSSSLFFLAF